MLTASHAIRCMALTLLVSILGSCPALGDILPVRDIYDDKFLDSTWRHEYEGNNQIAATLRQLGPSVGGDGYLQTIIKGFDGVSVVTYKAYHYSLQAFYVPSTSGPISSIRWDVYFQTYIGGHYLNLVARQGDGVYSSSQAVTSQQDISAWTHHVAVVDPATFVLVRGSGPERLDFSSCGGPIFFGYVNYNDTGIRETVEPECEKIGGCLLPGGTFHLARYSVQITPEQTVRITNVELLPVGTVRILWPSTIGQRYELQFTSDIVTTTWFAVAEGTAGACQTYVDVPPTLRHGFLRVRRL